MIRILIADDESIVRTSLCTMVDWNKEGFIITGDVPNGREALKLIEKGGTDILITDIKMPIMDGIELIHRLSGLPDRPVVIVLSAYDEFSFVRQAFKHGAVDYILKSDITPVTLLECVRNAALNITQHNSYDLNCNGIEPAELLRRAALGIEEPNCELFSQKYILACLEVDDFSSCIHRFDSDIEHSFVLPMLSSAAQVPRVASRCKLCSITPSRYLLLYNTQGQDDNSETETLHSICAQLSRNWNHYMNVEISAGISAVRQGLEFFNDSFNEACLNLSIKFILGRGGIYDASSYRFFNPVSASAGEESCASLIDCLKTGAVLRLPEERHAYIMRLYGLPREDAIKEVLGLIYHIALSFHKTEQDIIYSFNKSINFYEKLIRLDSTRDIEIWLINFLRWVSDYVEHNFQWKQADIIERARSFIHEQYNNPMISLASVAGYVGLNEKYLSSRFKSETGSSFPTYLNSLRIAKAKALMDKTDLKIYQICEQVGFNSVEHFSRVFKKITGISPSSYKQETLNS